MANTSLLFAEQYELRNGLHIRIPTVGEIIENEHDYYSLVSTFTAMPIDFLWQLDEFGIDFTEINEFELFLLMFKGVRGLDTSLISSDLDLKKFEIVINEQNGLPMLFNNEEDIYIDRVVYGQIASFLRKIHYIEPNRKRPANEEAKRYMIERARTKYHRYKNRKPASRLEPLIVALVNTEQYKYDFEETKNLTIYQFNASAQQVIRKINYDNRMVGIYTGNIDAKNLSQGDLTWMAYDKK